MRRARPARRLLRRHAAAVASIAAVLAILPTEARGQRGRFEADLRFARALAEEMQCVALAADELHRLRGRCTTDAQRYQVGTLEVELMLLDTRRPRDAADRLLFFQEAVRLADELAGQPGGEADRARALRTVVAASLECVAWLADVTAGAPTAVRGEVDALEQQAESIFRAGRQAADRILQDLRSAPAEAPVTPEALLIRSRRAILEREWARVAPRDRDIWLDRAAQELANVVLEAGEDTVLGLFAMFEHAQVRALRARSGPSAQSAAPAVDDGATAGFEDVAAAVSEVLDGVASGSIDQPESTTEALFTLFEAAHERIAAIRLAGGHFDGVFAATAAYREAVGRLLHGLPTDLDDPRTQGGEGRFGQLLYVSHALALARTGQASAAVRLTRALSDAHPRDLVGDRARKALAQIVAQLPDDHAFDPRLRLVAARGEHGRARYEAAVKHCRRVLAAPDVDPDTALAATDLMGWSMLRQRRCLEATLALQRGLASYGHAGDRARVRGVAASLQVATRHLRAQTRDDPWFDELITEARALAARHAGGGDDAATWADHLHYLSIGNREVASRQLARIGPDSVLYRAASVRLAVERWSANDLPAATARITAARAEATIASDPAACAAFDLLEARMLDEQATAARDSRTRVEANRRIVDLLADYELRYGAAMPQFVAEARSLSCRAHAELGDIAAARRELGSLIDSTADIGGAGPAAARLLGVLFERIAAADGAGDRDDLLALRRQACTVGTDYLAHHAAPSFTAGLLVLRQLEALADWPGVEACARGLIARFDDTDRRAELEAEVLPILGGALLRLRRFAEAHDVLVRAETAAPANYPIKRLISLALGGWAELDGRGSVTHVAGLLRPVEAYEKYATEYRIYGLNRDRGVERGSLDWFEFQWECYYFALGASRFDAGYGKRAREIYESMRDSGLSELRQRGERGMRIQRLFAASPPPGS